MKSFDVVIIGSGAAGINLSLDLYKKGVKNLLIIEKEPVLGGRLNSTNYNISKDRNILGVNYREELLNKLSSTDIEILNSTIVTKINEDNTLTLSNGVSGIFNIEAKIVVLCNGAKEKGRDLKILGSRVPGVFTSLMGEKILNLFEVLPGKNVAFFGYSNCGKELCKSLIEKGVSIEAIVSETPILNNYEVDPSKIYEGYTVTKVLGSNRVQSIVIEKDGDVRTINCDTFIIALPPIPDPLLAMRSGLVIENGAPLLEKEFESTRNNVFVLGNAEYIHESIEDIENDAEKLSKTILTRL